MKYVYLVETQEGESSLKNQQVFLLIQKLSIPDEQIFIDEDPISKPELEKLCGIIKSGDKLFLRSIVDLDTDLNCLMTVFLSYFSELKIEIVSCEEPFLNGFGYSDTLKSIIQMMKNFDRQKKKQGFQKAVKEKRVGRPVKTERVAKAIELHKTGKYKISEIIKLTGVSRSTLYRYIKNEK